MTRTLRLLCQLLQAAGQRVDDLFLPRPHGIDIDGGLFELQPPVVHLMGLVDHAGHMQERLRRNAASQQAGAPQARLGLDKRDVHAQVGGQERRRVTAGAAAENNEFGVHD